VKGKLQLKQFIHHIDVLLFAVTQHLTNISFVSNGGGGGGGKNNMCNRL